MLTGEQKAIQDMALDFAMAEMAPNAMRWDEEKIFPTDVLRELAQLGFAGVYIGCLLYTSPSPRDRTRSRMPSSA